MSNLWEATGTTGVLDGEIQMVAGRRVKECSCQSDESAIQCVRAPRRGDRRWEHPVPCYSSSWKWLSG
jgi:hypothetical protein